MLDQIKSVDVLLFCILVGQRAQLARDDDVSKKSKFCFIAKLFKLKSLFHIEVLLMCKWWPLLYRIGSHTPGFGVHTL